TKNGPERSSQFRPVSIGRDGGIRTHDPLTPRIARRDVGYTAVRYCRGRVRHILHHFWVAPTMHCVLVSVGDPPFLFVQVMSGDRAVYSQRVTDTAQAALAANDLRRTFVDDPH